MNIFKWRIKRNKLIRGMAKARYSIEEISNKLSIDPILVWKILNKTKRMVKDEKNPNL